MPPQQTKRPYQVVIWGATGFTGELVCEHIAHDYPGELRWALAGRNKEKLEKVRERLCKIHPGCKDVPIIVADTWDQKSVDRMVKQTDVIVATAGPFARVGTAIVESSLRMGTHYCDITGETLWIRKNIRQYHQKAREKKVKIVHCCGFDSIPSDLGTLMLVDHMRDVLQRKAARVDMLIGKTKGGISGGSIETTMDEFAVPYTDEEMAALNDPYCLDPSSSLRGGDLPDYWGIAYNHNAKCWTFPHRWATVNARVVRRSNALLENRYGRDFRYSEAAEAEGPVDAMLGAMAIGFVHFVACFRPARELLRALLPKPGEGPPQEFQHKGYWNIRLMGFTEENSSGQKPRKVEARIRGRRDPGYWETSRMVLESGLCLALDEEELKEQKELKPGGVLTPTTAMGHVLIRRLRRAGMTFEIVTPDPPASSPGSSKTPPAPARTGTSPPSALPPSSASSSGSGTGAGAAGSSGSATGAASAGGGIAAAACGRSVAAPLAWLLPPVPAPGARSKPRWAARSLTLPTRRRELVGA